MAKILYTNKSNAAASGSAAKKWRDIDANEVKTSVNALYDTVDTKADSIGDTTVHTGTSWDGTPKYRELTGNLALTLSTTEKSGLFVAKQDATGSRTLSINGVSIPITSTANAVSLVQFFYDSAGGAYRFIVDTAVSYAADLTAPTLVSATIESGAPDTIVLTFSEAIDSGSIPAAGAFNVEVEMAVATVDSVSHAGGAVVHVVLDTPVAAGENVDLDYTQPGVNNLQDAAGNDVANILNYTVTNNVAGGGSFPSANRLGYWVEDDMVKAGGIVTDWPESTANGADWEATATVEPIDATTDGLQSTAAGAHQMTLAAPLSIPGAFSIYFWISRTGSGTMLSAGAGSYYAYMDGASVQSKPNSLTGASTIASVIPTGSWRVVCMTYSGVDGEFMKLYVDGSLVGSFGGGNIYEAGGYSVANLLGANAGINFDGYLKRVAIFTVEHNGTDVGTNSTSFIA
jgi:hypothetical protein